MTIVCTLPLLNISLYIFVISISAWKKSLWLPLLIFPPVYSTSIFQYLSLTFPSHLLLRERERYHLTSHRSMDPHPCLNWLPPPPLQLNLCLYFTLSSHSAVKTKMQLLYLFQNFVGVGERGGRVIQR